MAEQEEKSVVMNQRINTQQANYAGEAQQQLQITDSPLVRESAPS
jgi:hypothetical protein